MPYKDPNRRRDRMPKEAECPYGSVACCICGRRFSSMGTHLARTHGITAREYRERFPGAVTLTAEARATNALNLANGRAALARTGGRTKVTYAVA